MSAGLPERVESRILRDAPGDCWIWTGAVDTDGYGRYSKDPAHRLVYVSAVGPIPDGLQIDHLCRVRPCVNPAHLEPVTAAENNRRRDEALGLGVYATHCKNGHEFTPENTRRRVRAGGQEERVCRACIAVRQRAYVARIRNAAVV